MRKGSIVETGKHVSMGYFSINTKAWNEDDLEKNTRFWKQQPSKESFQIFGHTIGGFSGEQSRCSLPSELATDSFDNNRLVKIIE